MSRGMAHHRAMLEKSNSVIGLSPGKHHHIMHRFTIQHHIRLTFTMNLSMWMNWQTSKELSGSCFNISNQIATIGYPKKIYYAPTCPRFGAEANYSKKRLVKGRRWSECWVLGPCHSSHQPARFEVNWFTHDPDLKRAWDENPIRLLMCWEALTRRIKISCIQN